jgi:outer membrane lipoprotein-sorting protein
MNITSLPVKITTHIVISDADSGEILREGSNAIHQENMSQVFATALSHGTNSFISEMHFGKGASVTAINGSISYRTPNVFGTNSDLYNPLYFKVVDGQDLNNLDANSNSVTVTHTTGTTYSNTVVTATLEYNDPVASNSVFNIVNSTENSLNATTTVDGEMVFDEIALKTKGTAGLNSGKLLTHFIFHPVEKSYNQRIQIVYTLKVQAG